MRGGRTLGLICQVESVRIVSCLQGANVVILGTLQDLGERTQVDTQWDRPVATILGESRSLKFDGNERDVGVVHRLQGLEWSCEQASDVKQGKARTMPSSPHWKFASDTSSLMAGGANEMDHIWAQPKRVPSRSFFRV